MMPKIPATRPIIHVIFLGAEGAAIQVGVNRLMSAQDGDIALHKGCTIAGIRYICYGSGTGLLQVLY